VAGLRSSKHDSHSDTEDNPGILPPRKSGRPSKSTVVRMRDHILDVATALFLKRGYGLTSIEAVAREARISKLTFYHRFADKADLFRAVVHRIIDSLHPPANVPLIGEDNNLQENLQRLAKFMLQGALSPPGLALTRLIMAGSTRFPELADIASRQGGRQKAITIVSGLLESHARTENIPLKNPTFAAEQFLQMVINIPQRRAMGLGTPMTPDEIEAWVPNTVELFLNGCFGKTQTP